MQQIKLISLLLAIALLTLSCKKEETRPALQIPTTYDGTGFLNNSTTARGLVNQLIALTDEAKKGRIEGTVVERSALENLFTTGNPSLAATATAYYKGRLEGANGWFADLAAASGGTYTPGAPTGQGGVFGTGASAYLFDENGLEIEQLVEKGQFAATLYNHLIAIISSGNIDAAKVDQLLAVYGATPAFANSGSNNVAAENRDRAMANYAARRDKNDGQGLYSQTKFQFLKLQAAVKAGEAYNTERDEAIAEIKLLWEKINAATIINYCHSTIAGLSQTSPTENQQASALHAYAEAVGFIHGFRTIPQNHKRISDAQIDAILVLLNAPYNATPTSYKFVTDAVNELPKLTQIINQLKGIYGFTDQEIEDFKSNWVNIQGR
jgi:hypothetical protein